MKSGSVKARALVISSLVSALVAAAVASAVLGHGSGTYFASLLVLPFLVAPGALVWFSPRQRWFVVWAVVALVASVAYLGFGDPYQSERELAGWRAVEVSMWIAMSISTVGAMAGAFALGARAGVDLDTPLARRLRRIVQLCAGLAVLAAALCWLPGERVYAGHTYLHDRTAGGGYLVAFLALLLVPGVLVYRDPRKRWAWLWMVWSLPASLLVLVVVIGLHLFTHGEDLWPLVVVRFATLTIIVLLVLGLPLVALLTRERAVLPEARVSA